jgi:hypothetical protein
MVALVVVGAVVAAVGWQCLAGRRLLDHRQDQLQAEWLARAGLELAADRLLADPAGYKGESAELVPGAVVRVEVRADPAARDVFRVTSEARVSRGGPDAVVRTARRTFRRTEEGRGVRLEAVLESSTAPARTARKARDAGT